MKKRTTPDPTPLNDLAERYLAAGEQPGEPPTGAGALVRRIALRQTGRARGKAGPGLAPGAEDATRANVGAPAARPRPRKPGPPPGSLLVRMWHGEEIRVVATETGFQWRDVEYRSLSALARAVTGAKWNGRLFFGLTGRKRGPR